jgi:hypothetical protein
LLPWGLDSSAGGLASWALEWPERGHVPEIHLYVSARTRRKIHRINRARPGLSISGLLEVAVNAMHAELGLEDEGAVPRSG